MFGSGSVKRFIIVLDNPTKAYFAGQIVSGIVILELDQERKTSGLKLNFYGKANVRWTESHTVTTGTGSNRSTRTETRTYSDNENYFEQKIYIIGGGGPDVILPPGIHEHRFSFQLPLGIPSSFKGRHGYVQYGLTATLKKSWGFNKTSTAIFTVNAIVDLNTYPGATSPGLCTKHKTIGCLCCTSGPVNFTVKMSRTGFVPGEGLDLQVEMVNTSSREIRTMKIYLKQTISFHARGKTRRNTETIKELVGPGVKAGETELWRPDPSYFRLPAIPPTNLGGCRIISVEYAIHAKMEIPNALNLTGSMPLLVGTIPLRNYFEYMRPQAPLQPTITPPSEPFGVQPGLLPSAPPFLSIPGYPDLPPPSYEDALGLPSYDDAVGDVVDAEAGSKESNGNESAYDPNFVPRYATFGWMYQPPQRD